MRAYHLLLAGLIASAVAGSAWAQSSNGAGKEKAAPSRGIDFNGATGGDHGASAGFDTSGVKGGYSFQGGGLPSTASGVPPLSAPPPSSAIGNGPPGPPPPVRAGITGVQP